MEHEKIIHDFFIESAKVNVEKTFSFDSAILLSENFDSCVMKTIFITKLPILKQILKQNQVEMPETLLYQLIKMKTDMVIEQFEKFLTGSTTLSEQIITAKTNLIKFKIGCILTLVILNHDYSRQWDLVREISSLHLHCKSGLDIASPETEITFENFIRQFVCELPEVQTIKSFLVTTFQQLEMEASEMEYFNKKCTENEEKDKEKSRKKRSYAEFQSSLAQQGNDEDLANRQTESKKHKTIGDYFQKSSRESLGFKNVKEIIETNKINLNDKGKEKPVGTEQEQEKTHEKEKQKEKTQEKEKNFQVNTTSQSSLDEVTNSNTGCNNFHSTILNNINADSEGLNHSMLSLPLKGFASQQGVLSNYNSTFYSTNSRNSNSKLTLCNFDMSSTHSETSNSNFRSNSGTVYQRDINARLKSLPMFVNTKKHKHGDPNSIKRNPNKDQILEKLFDKVQSTQEASQMNKSAQEGLSTNSSSRYLNLKRIVNKKFYAVTSQLKTPSPLPVENTKYSKKGKCNSNQRISKSNPHSNENSNLIPHKLEDKFTALKANTHSYQKEKYSHQNTNLEVLEKIKMESVKKANIKKSNKNILQKKPAENNGEEEVLVYRTPEKDIVSMKFGKRSPHLHSKANLLNLFQQINEIK